MITAKAYADTKRNLQSWKPNKTVAYVLYMSFVIVFLLIKLETMETIQKDLGRDDLSSQYDWSATACPLIISVICIWKFLRNKHVYKSRKCS